MTFEMEIVDAPDPLPLNFKYDSGRSRTLIKTNTVRTPGHIDVRITADWAGAPPAVPGYFITLDARDDKDGDIGLYRDTLIFNDQFRDWFGDIERGEGTRTKTFRVRFEDDEIVGQYENGVYEGNMVEPGPLELVFSIGDTQATAPTSLAVPAGARVKENTELRNPRLSVDGTTVTPQVDVAVKASHETDLPVAVTGSVGGEEVVSEPLTIKATGSIRGGPEVTPATLPSFELDDIPYQTNEVRYRIQPRDWAAEWVEPAEATTTVDNISVNDVEITGCRVTPEQVVAGDQVTVRSSVSNPLPVAVGVEGRIDFGGAQSAFSQQIGAGETVPVTGTFRTEEPGTAEPTIRLTSVGGNV